jgi:HAD superfamily hydrolase (TIGR01490 family)
MKRIAALFDCDGTIYSAQYGRGLMKYAAERGHKGAVRRYFASLLPLLALRKFKLITEEKFHRPLTSRMAWMVKGMTEDEFRELSECLFSEYLLPTERSEVVARLREHQANGHAVVLVSAQFSPSLEVLAGHYNAYGFVGTKIEIKNGLYTGRIIPPVITGADKDRYAREHLLSKGMEVDWEASYAYADSITDTGLINMAGHPVAVHPDAKLFDLAKSRKWEMIGDRKPEG